MLPVLLVTVMWMASLGFHVYSQGVVSSAAREAARHAAIHGTADPLVRDRANKTLELVLPPNPGGGAITVEENGGVITASIVYDYDPLIDYNSILGLLGASSNTQIRLSGVSHFKKEYPGP